MKRRHANPFSDASQASSTSTRSPVSQTTFKEPTIASGADGREASEPVRARGYLRAGLPFKEDGEAEGAENGRAVR
jgi:hypothetical protein